MKRFVCDIKKYWSYTRYAAGSSLKAEVANSYLNWLWWILNPLLFMFVYMFIAQIVFHSSEKAFPVFVFIGLTIWDFFNRNVISSVKLVRNKSGIISKVYLPKYVLVLSKMMENGVKMLISFAIVLVMMPFFHLPFSWLMIHLIPIFLVLFLLTFGVSTIAMHLGVFVDDLYNVVQVLLRLVFYMCGVFYSLESRLPAPYNHILLKGNPVAFCIHSARQILIEQTVPQYKFIFIWLAVGLLLSAFGVWLIYRYENSYVKVI